MPKVLKPFKTLNRRFAVGADVEPADCTGSASYEDLVARGFIEGAAPAAKAESAKASKSSR